MYRTDANNNQLPKTGAAHRGTAVLWGVTAAIIFTGCFAIGSAWFNAKPMEFVPPQTAPDRIVETLKAMPVEKRSAILKAVGAQLQSNPTDLTQLLRLAALTSANGDESQSEALTLLAANRSHDDARLQANALQIELKRKDFAAALNRIDTLFKTAPELTGDLLKTLIRFAQNAESFPALIAKLIEKPEWRAQFILALTADKTIDAPVLYSVFSELRKGQSGETPYEMRYVLARLLDDKQYDKAYFMWVDSLSDVQLKKAGTIFDGSFELPIDNLFFSWSIVPMPNVEARTVARAPGSIDMVLRLDFTPARTPYENVSQLLRLTPGAYKLSYEAKADNLKTSNGLVWRLYCLGQTPIKIGETPRLVGSQPWGRYGIDLQIPERDCAQQVLRLYLDAPTPLDAQVEGSASFDSFSIDPVVTETGG